MRVERHDAEPKLTLTPQDFWREYCSALISAKAWSHFSDSKKWTSLAIEAARTACGRFVHYTDNEYLRLDMVGFERMVDSNGKEAQNNWRLKIAFEHENGADWAYELCKLTDIAADLRVLISYANLDKPVFPELIQIAVDRLRDRIAIQPSFSWLIAFGPYSTCTDRHFVAWTLSPDIQLKRIGESVRLELPSEVRPEVSSSAIAHSAAEVAL